MVSIVEIVVEDKIVTEDSFGIEGPGIRSTFTIFTALCKVKLNTCCWFLPKMY